MESIWKEFPQAKLVCAVDEKEFIYALVRVPLSETQWLARIQDKSDIERDFKLDESAKNEEEPAGFLKDMLTSQKMLDDDVLVRTFSEKQKMKDFHYLFVLTKTNECKQRIHLDSLLPEETRLYIEFSPQFQIVDQVVAIEVRERARTYAALDSYKTRFNGDLSSLLFFDQMYPQHLIIERKLKEQKLVDPTEISRDEIEEFQAKTTTVGGSSHVEFKRRAFANTSNPEKYGTWYCGKAICQVHLDTATLTMVARKAESSCHGPSLVDLYKK